MEGTALQEPQADGEFQQTPSADGQNQRVWTFMLEQNRQTLCTVFVKYKPEVIAKEAFHNLSSQLSL